MEEADKYLHPSRKGGLSPRKLDELKRSIALAVVREFAPAQIRAQILANLYRWRMQGAWVSAYDKWHDIAVRDDAGARRRCDAIAQLAAVCWPATAIRGAPPA